jgi:pilus assembly protein TadC
VEQRTAMNEMKMIKSVLSSVIERGDLSKAKQILRENPRKINEVRVYRISLFYVEVLLEKHSEHK